MGIEPTTLGVIKYAGRRLSSLGHDNYMEICSENQRFKTCTWNLWNLEIQLLIGANFLYEVIQGSPLNHGFLHMFTIDLSQKIEPLFAILKFRRF